MKHMLDVQFYGRQANLLSDKCNLELSSALPEQVTEILYSL